MKVKILGYGEIGKSLAEVYRKKFYEPAWQDMNESSGDIECELLHVCIPYNEYFVDIVLKEIRKSIPKYVVIHSTVKVGTTRIISNLINKETNVIVCHSPVIGVHPNLTESLLTFTKWMGIDEVNDSLFMHFWLFDIDVSYLGKPEATEIMKLWDTTYYGMCLAINAEVKNMLNENDINYSNWIAYLKAYNDGYKKMNMPNVSRPYFPILNMPIKGHCIIPNYNILKEMTDMNGFNLLDTYSK